MGKQKVIDLEQLGALCRLKPTLADCAAFFKCSEDTIERRIRDQYKCTFSEFRDMFMVHSRFDLIRMALKKAEKSDTILIFCLKNLCGWGDRADEKANVNVQINNQPQLSEMEIAERIEQLKIGGHE